MYCKENLKTLYSNLPEELKKFAYESDAGDVGGNGGNTAQGPAMDEKSNVDDCNNQQSENLEYPDGFQNWTLRKQTKWLTSNTASGEQIQAKA